MNIQEVTLSFLYGLIATIVNLSTLTALSDVVSNSKARGGGGPVVHFPY